LQPVSQDILSKKIPHAESLARGIKGFGKPLRKKVLGPIHNKIKMAISTKKEVALTHKYLLY